jgi:hypothetical protein
MSFIQLFADAFLEGTCECCGRTFTGRLVYRAGLLQCQSCANGDHRHERVREAA